MNSSKLHKNFKLNGEIFTTENDVIFFSKNKIPSLYGFLRKWFNEEDFISIQTSGSTGKPKTIQLKKEYMINSAKATGTFFDLPENTTALLCLSADYIAGKMMLVRALVLGWQLDVVEPSSNPLNGLASEYNFSAMVPLQLENSLSEISRIEKVIVGGAPVSKVLLEKLQKLPTAVFATYGMTETITHIAIKPLNTFRHAELVSASHYTVLPNINISKDDRGCLVINAPQLSDAPIITNDVVEILSETEFKWLGRFDTIINSGGVKLIPEQIERKLSAIIDHRFFTIGIPDEKLGKKLVLVIEASSLKIEDLKVKLKNLTSLDKFEVPKEIHTVMAFVETETKKIKRKETLEIVNNNLTN